MSYPLMSLLLGSGILVSVGKYLVNRIKKTEVKTEAVCLGVQALLRDRLLQSYNHYKEKDTLLSTLSKISRTCGNSITTSEPMA